MLAIDQNDAGDPSAVETLQALRDAAPEDGPAVETAIRQAAVSAGYSGLALADLPASLGMSDGEFRACAAESPDLPLGFALGFALRWSHLSARGRLRDMVEKFTGV